MGKTEHGVKMKRVEASTLTSLLNDFLVLVPLGEVLYCLVLKASCTCEMCGDSVLIEVYNESSQNQIFVQSCSH